ncbi:hypothetical protein [Agathobacter sp.]|uniref:hypothetical protein n=1 Tax=Agathobacter sp. TaxID=2021311 RepID=UPI003FD87562
MKGMKQRSLMKRVSAVLMAATLTISAFPQLHTNVHAAENQLPTKEQFATAEELKKFNTDDRKDYGGKNPAKVYFGNNNQQWWIAGSQDGNLTLFAASPLAKDQPFESNTDQKKKYEEYWNCDYTSTGGTAPTEVYPSHYGASPLRTKLKDLESSCFTKAEQGLMTATTVYTNDIIKDGSVYSTTDKLYLAYGDFNSNNYRYYITVGANQAGNLNNGLRIDKYYWGDSAFWLRAPYKRYNYDALVASPGCYVSHDYVYDHYALVPAFELNLSSVIFASAAPAASFDGSLTLQDTDGKGAFTLRYDATKFDKNLGSALVSNNKSQVTLTNVPENTYLVVQNGSGAWAKKIINEAEVSASEMSLENFTNCKIWLETTDTKNRMTYATLAKEKQGYDVNVVVSEGLNITSNNGVQEVAPNTKITDIVVEVSGGYYLPEDYISNLQGKLPNELSVAKTDNGFKISGTPTSDVNITLPAATVDTTLTLKQFATVEELKTFDTNDQDEDGKNPAKVYFGNNNQQWWIAGSQDGNLTLFAASSLEKKPFESNDSQDKAYSAAWNCDYTSTGGTAPTEVFSNHYGASPLRKTLQGLETSYFTSKEQKLMNDTTVYTNDTKNGSVYSTTDKLYLAYGDFEDKDYVTVGKNASDSLNNGLRIDKDYWGDRDFWLRAPHGTAALVADTTWSHNVAGGWVNISFARVPAFELNLSDVLFGSTVSAVTSGGTLSTNDAFTLRYKADSLGSALVSNNKSQVTLTNVPENTYLVVQNGSGAWAKKIINEAEVSASEMSLENFTNCKIWLETTDTKNRMTYATLAKEKQGYDVNVASSDELIITNGVQSVVKDSAITDITVKVDDGYYLPDNYKDTIQGLNGLNVKDFTQTGFTISGTPKGDVNITLPAATKKVYSMIVTGSGTFTTVCKGYQPITANEFTIANNGNVDLTNVNVSLTGTNADKFELSADNTTTTIQPNGATKVTVKPIDALGVGTYKAKLSVSADNVNTATTDLQFIVNEHEYKKVVTRPTCTEKGYTTYTCKNCNHSYKDDEVDAKGHTFGEWEIITSQSCDKGGSRQHTCIVCGYVEIENLNPTGHAWEDDYRVDKEPTCTGDGSKSIHCKNCDAVKDSTTIAKLGHDFTGEWEVTKKATCTEAGTKIRKCSRCDEIKTEIIPATGHTEVEDAAIAATCTTAGKTAGSHCSVCNAVIKAQEEIPAAGHSFGEWETVKSSTCNDKGSQKRVCKVCGYTETKDVDANGHTWEKDYTIDKEPTCTAEGNKSIHCKNCDEVKDSAVIKALGHDFTGEWKVTKKATCTEAGTKIRQCSRCDEIETEIIQATGHKLPTKWTSNGDGTHSKKCQNSECKYLETAECSGGIASYFKKAVCSTCGAEYGELTTDTILPTGEINVKNNIWNSFLNTITFGKYFKETQKVTITGTDDSYQADGFDSSKNVKVSYLLVSGSDAKAYTTEALAEKYSAKEFKEYTASFNLNPDNKYVVFARIEDHAGNVTFVSSDGMIVDATAPTVNGLENNKTYCGDVKFTVTDEHLDKVTDTISEETKTLEAVDGEYILSAGTHKITATDKAGNKTEVNVTVNAGHSFGEWETVKSSTCNDKGSQKRVCKVCGYTETKDVDANGHTWEKDYTVDKEPTCTTEGSKSIHCKNCDEVKDSAVIKALGHDFTGKWKVTKKATCTEQGTKERKCSRCDEIETETIPATGHTEVEDAAVAATCTTAGKTAGSHCVVCNAVIKAQEEIPAAGHSWSEWSSDGKQEKSTCSVCGQKKYRNTDDGDDIGKIEKEAEVTPDSPFGEASLDTNKEDLIAAKGIFTPEEKAEVENGVNARIWVEISSTENLTEENRQKIEALAKKLMGSDISNLTYFDAELFKSVTKDGVSTKSQINEPGAHIEISLRLPESLVSKDIFILRKYRVIRLHDGKVDSLDAEFDKETNTLKFVTDRFSTYAIAYTDNIPSDDNSNRGSNNKPNSKPNTNSVILTDNKKHDNQKVISSKTGDTSDVTLWTTVFAVALAGIIGIFARRKKEQQ